MTDWTAGYRTEITYTHGYYAELNPLRLPLAFLAAGLRPPTVGIACELGFGQGITVNMHATASQVQWAGTDFNPTQAGFAQEVAQNAGNGARLYDEGFAEFCVRTDLPEFDYISLHGIWAWVSDENRAVIVDFIRRKLKVGGVLYISYNTQPGWAAMLPMRNLLSHYFESQTKGGTILSRVDSTLAFADQLMALNPLFARANPQIAQRIEKIKGQNRAYIAHEYFNGHWDPMSFAQMAQWLAPAKLQWATSAHILDAIAPINLTAEQQQLLAGISDPVLQQSVRDFCTNQQFRKDYWVKGARTLAPLECAELLRTQRVILIQERSQIELKATGSLGSAELKETTYAPLLDQLADLKPKTLGQLEQALQAHGMQWPQIFEAVLVLTGSGKICPAHSDEAIQKAKKRTDRLNTWLMHKARGGGDVQYFASPVTGGGVSVARFDQLFLLARQQGHKAVHEWAAFTWNVLKMQGQRIVKEGKTLETDEDNLAEITAQAAAFQKNRLPLLKALQVV